MPIEKSHLALAAGAALAATVASVGITHVTRPPAAHVRVSPNTWEELTQAQVDALTALLKKMPPRDVAIFCLRGCDDLALSFDNAFESAHWKSGIEAPLMDDTVGVAIGPDDADGRALRTAIHEATRGAINPRMVDARLLEGRLALVLGRKR